MLGSETGERTVVNIGYAVTVSSCESHEKVAVAIRRTPEF
jgi:hypothetical protein